MSGNSNGHEKFNGWRTQPMYTFGETANLAGVSASTVRNWLFGYTTKDREASPLFRPPTDQGSMVSFLQLIEIVVAANFRKEEHTSFQTVRLAHKYAQGEYGLEYPFAHLKLKAIGGHIVHQIHGVGPRRSLQAVDQPQQWTLPGLVGEVIEKLDYESELAARWYPVGKDVPIIVDPRISSGVPTVLGRGVTIRAIRARFKAGQKMEFIAGDFDLAEDVVEEVLRYAERVAA